MKIKSCYLAFLLFSSLSAFAQNTDSLFSLEGRIWDSAAQKPVAFATVRLRQGSSAGTTRLTNEAGFFRFDRLRQGTYKLAFTALNYAPMQQDIFVAQSVVLGDVGVKIKDKQMAGIVVQANRPLIRQDIDRLIYDVQADGENKIMNSFDLFRKLPFVSIGPNNEVMLKGNSNFKVLIDGRESSLFAHNIQDVLRSMPAANIKEVQVITTPPARYDGEGLAGIINIITLKKTAEGYNGSINANYSNLLPGFGGSVTAKSGRFGWSAFANQSWEHAPKAPMDKDLQELYPVAAHILQQGSKSYDGNFTLANVLLSMEVDSLNLLTASFGYNRSRGNQVYGSHNTLYRQDGVLEQSYDLLNDRHPEQQGFDAGLNYQLGFKKDKSAFLTLSYRFASFISNLHSQSLVQLPFNYPSDNLQQRNHSGQHEHTMQADYVKSVRKLTIESGIKVIRRDHFSGFEYTRFDSVRHLFEPDLAQSGSFDYTQTVLGFYHSYQLRLKTWAFRTGLRLEHTSIDADFKNNNLVKQDYLRLFPVLVAQHSFKNVNNISLGYSERIQRPGITQLNPFIDKSDPRYYATGNPTLRPVLVHNLDLTYSHVKKININLNFNYAFARKTIQSVNMVTPDSVLQSTYQNIGRSDNLGINISIGAPLARQLSLTVNARLAYSWIEGRIGGEAFSNSGLQGLGYGYLTYRIKDRWRFAANGGYYGPVLNLQGHSGSYFYSSFSASHTMMKNKATISLSAGNPFRRFRTVKNRLVTEYFYQQANSALYVRNINLAFFYTFGKLKTPLKKNRRSINNDDKVTEAP